MIADHKGEVPFIVYIIPFITGIVAGLFIDGSLIVSYVLAVFLIIFFIGLNIFYTRLKVYNYQWLGGMLIHLILLVAGYILVKQYDDRSKPTYFSSYQASYLTVIINNEPVLKGKYYHCSTVVTNALFHQKQQPVTGKLLLTVMADSTHHLQYGDQLLIPANYKPIDPPFNPAMFNYKSYLAHQNIYNQCFLFPGQYKILSQNNGNALIAYAFKLRQQFVNKLNANVEDAGAAAVASTLILGYKADLSEDILQAYSKTGTIHVLSVSGAHVAIVFVFINFALSYLNGSRIGQWFKAIISILLIWAYAMLTGFSPAVCRAAVMLTMIILGRAGYRYTNTSNLLALSAFILLMYNPT